MVDCLRHFHQVFFRVLQHHVDRGDGGVARQQLVAQQRFGQRHGFTLGQEVGLAGLRVFDQVFDDQVVVDRVGVLEVADRIDADREGYLPGLFGQAFDRGQRLLREGGLVGRFEHEQEVVVFGVGVLQVFECLQLGVGVREEYAVVGRKLEPACAEARAERERERH